jgi:cytidylate kinase
MTGWEVLDREVLECLAELYRTSPAVLKLVDETTSNWMSEIFDNGICRDFTAQTEYMYHLTQVILMAAQGGKVIYVGRGAHFLLPHRRGLVVRLVASPGFRVQQIVERRHLNYDKARDYVEKTDAGRQEFVRQYFHHDIAAPHLYDLMVNVERIGPQRTAQLIADAVASCFDARRSP